MSLYTKLTFLVCSLTLLACSPKTIGELGERPEKLERVKTGELLEAMDRLSAYRPGTFYTKINTNYQDTTTQVSFKTSLRIVKDSAIGALIKYAAIPIANAIITLDSVLIVNKRSKCYTKESFAYLKEKFDISFDYKNIEELLYGMPLAYDSEQKYFQIHDPFHYIISTHKKRNIRKSDRKEKFHDDIIFKYFLRDDLLAVERMEVDSKEDTTHIVIDYLTHQLVDSILMPEDVVIQIRTPRNLIRISMNYSKVELNVPQDLFFVIPESYEECE